MLHKEDEKSIPTGVSIYALLCNSINDLNLYYKCSIKCYEKEEITSAANHVQLIPLALSRIEFENIRRIKNWNRNNNPYILKEFEEEDRYKIFDIIYDYPKRTPDLIKEWIKLFLMGTQNFNVFLVDKETGRTCEALVIDRINIEKYFEVSNANLKMN